MAVCVVGNSKTKECGGEVLIVHKIVRGDLGAEHNEDFTLAGYLADV